MSHGGNNLSNLWMLLSNKQVVDKLQSGGNSVRESWRTELPSTGLGVGVMEQMKDEKIKYLACLARQMREHKQNTLACVLILTCVYFCACSVLVVSRFLFAGTLIGGSEFEGNFSLINEACSLFAGYCWFSASSPCNGWQTFITVEDFLSESAGFELLVKDTGGRSYRP